MGLRPVRRAEKQLYSKLRQSFCRHLSNSIFIQSGSLKSSPLRLMRYPGELWKNARTGSETAPRDPHYGPVESGFTFLESGFTFLESGFKRIASRGQPSEAKNLKNDTFFRGIQFSGFLVPNPRKQCLGPQLRASLPQEPGFKIASE